MIEALRASLAVELLAVERVAAMARDEATGEETKSEGKYDTRATEASYLARGQAWRVAELRRLVAWFEVLDAEESSQTVRLGSLVQVGGHRSGWLFLAPVGGLAVDVEGEGTTVRVRVISPDSPLGAALVDLEAGDGFEVESPQGPVEYEVIEVQ